ncbi:MAG: aminoglycoside phosphotransferase family protein [Pseudomonadota bacterium]
MNGKYLGRLSTEDPLHHHLGEYIAPQFGCFDRQASYRVFQADWAKDVYYYEEERGWFRVVGKFFKPSRTRSWDQARGVGETEYNNLCYLRDLGFSGAPFHVVRPLVFQPDINNLLVLEYLEGELLSQVINQAVFFGRRRKLFRKLSVLAGFLASLHNRTAGDWTINFNESRQYLSTLLDLLIHKRGLGREHAGELHYLGDMWRERDFMWEDRSVLVHGDATPANFMFGPGSNVRVFDLERMKWADRVFDVGRLAGELKHFFFRSTGDPWSAEPFIGHFLWEYAGHFPDHDRAFRSITRRVPFYLGLTLLRIAKNHWVDSDYRKRLVEEAKQALRAKT